MNFFKKTLTAVFLLALVFSCKNEPKTEIISVNTTTENTSTELNPNATYSKAEFNIKGMTCEMGCAKTIEKKLARMEGVKSATVDFKNELAMVEYDVAQTNPSSITKTVTSVADTYSVENMQTVATFSGAKKTCEKACCTDKLKAEKKECIKDCKKECFAKKA